MVPRKHVAGRGRARRIILLLYVGAVVHAPVVARAAEPQEPAPKPTLQARCGAPFQDNAVLQQQIPLPVWGTSLPKAQVTITLAGRTKTTAADKDGAWRVVLDPMKAAKLGSVNEAPKGETMVIACELGGERAVTRIRNIVIGEVWLCAGQSNMAGKLGTNKTRHFPEDTVAKADYPALRQMLAGQDEPWLICTPQTAPQFKKTCFFFARRVRRGAMVPVGVILAARGGSRIETWLNRAPFEVGANYRSMIAPVVGYGLRGAIWYQGESNAKDGRAYLPKLRSLILGWRDAWRQPDSRADDGPRGKFSFYFVQLPGIGTSPGDNPAGGDGRAEIRQAQFEALAIANTGMSVGIDIGDVREHPPNKYDTGVRLARWALHRDYGLKKLIPSGPLYKDHVIEGSSVRVRFHHAGKGLMLARKKGFLPPKPAPEAKLAWLSIQDKSGAWHWAEGRIDGTDLIVSCEKVKQPIAVRYAYTNHPTGSLLYNKEGLPAGPFSTNGYGK